MRTSSRVTLLNQLWGVWANFTSAIAGCRDSEMEGCEETIINEKARSEMPQMGKGTSALD